ncbi:MAG TPA: hypothetical protein VMS77_01545 [Conexivisphaerales archaeon]|nr:hypothetical protein [Conexivisphaerales archaeon]
MRRIGLGEASELKWVQPKKLQRVFHLLSGEEVVGTLEWKSSFGSLATGRAAGEEWTFKRGGFLSPYVSLRYFGTETDYARFSVSWGNGVLKLPTGRTFLWTKKGVWSPEYSFLDADGSSLLTFRRFSGLFKMEATASVSEKARELRELPLLLLLGWYTVLLMAYESAAAGAAASSAY